MERVLEVPYFSTYYITYFHIVSSGRLVGQPLSNYDDTITSLSQSLIELKESFDTGIRIHNAFVSSRIAAGVNKLGPFICFHYDHSALSQ